MNIMSRISALMVTLALVLVSCSSDDTPTGGGGPTDTTPPSITGITSIDASHVDIMFDEDLNRDSAERSDHYVIVESTVPLTIGEIETAPGDTIHVASASLRADQRTVAIATYESMTTAPYNMYVVNVADLKGNRISTPVASPFTGSSDPDVTAPQIVSRSPLPNATGVGTAEPVTVRFSEQVQFSGVMSGFSWTNGGPVAVDIESNDEVTFVFTPLQPLTLSTVYTVTMSGVQDYAGNTMATMNWSFTTTGNADTKPPTLVSSIPANGATNVNVNTNLSLTFSEAINQTMLEVQVTPDVGSGFQTWSNGGRTITFDPDLPLATNQAYSLSILPGGVEDLAGNGIAEVVNINFSTGATIPTGRIAGTIAGDPTSNTVNDPTGAIVIAADRPPFGDDNFGVGGSDIVAGNNTYDMRNVPDGTYYPICAIDANGDGQIEPDLGDAIGAYGADLSVGDFSLDSVTVAGGGSVTGVNFGIFDPSAIAGTIEYSGAYSGGGYPIYVAAFDTTAFDPLGTPDFSTVYYWPDTRPWVLNEFDGELGDGTFYIAAFMDIGFDGDYNPGSDPAGIYGGGSTPIPVHVEGGSDVLDAVITLNDPGAAVATKPVSWNVVKRDRPTWLERFSAVIHERGDALHR